MNIFDEINNRWFRVFEQQTDDGQKDQVLKLDPLDIAKDVKTLQDRVHALERDVTDSQNKFSSRFGPLLDIKDGTLYYRLRGLFVKISTIYSALEFLVHLLKTDETVAKKFRTQFGAEVENEVKEIYNDPI